MKTSIQQRFERHFVARLFAVLALLGMIFGSAALAQVNSGSDGHDGVLNPTANISIDMADHPDGIYQYTSVNIPNGVTISFIRNAKNTPVVWLVQGKVVIAGTVDISGQRPPVNQFGVGGSGGPGGFAGGNGGNSSLPPTDGLGPGGGSAAIAIKGGNTVTIYGGGEGGFGTVGTGGQRPGQPYGNKFLLPLLGGSGGGGGLDGNGGGGGGGALVIASSDSISINGVVNSSGASPGGFFIGQDGPGGGSGGAIRLVASRIVGVGTLTATDEWVGGGHGNGRIRLDCYENQFGGTIRGEYSTGFQPIILPALGNGIALAIDSVAGLPVAANPSGALATPAVIIPGQQANPITIVVRCANIPLNTEITVEVKPVNTPVIRAVGVNNSGTQASSTATVSVNMPRGGGIIQAKAVTGIAGVPGAAIGVNKKNQSLAKTGWTVDGERFAAMEITATLGGQQQFVYLTESGKRYPLQTAR